MMGDHMTARDEAERIMDDRYGDTPWRLFDTPWAAELCDAIEAALTSAREAGRVEGLARAEQAEAALAASEAARVAMANRLAMAKAALIASDHTRAFTEVDAALTPPPRLP